MLVGGDHRRRDLRSRKQLSIVGSHEIGADLIGDELGPIRLYLRESDEVDLRMARRDFSTRQPDSAGADNAATDALWMFLGHHAASCYCAYLLRIANRQRHGHA